MPSDHYTSLVGQPIYQLQNLQESLHMLQSIFDTSLIGISIFKAVRDENGLIRDFEIKFLNKESERKTGRNGLQGKFYTEEYPESKKTGLFNLMLRVMSTGYPEQLEYIYPYNGVDKWFQSVFVKIDDGLIGSNQDITGRKLAELEKNKNLALLKQAEAIAGMGSWDYNYKTGIFCWSSGMYRLFELAYNSIVSPVIYLQFATKKSLLVAGRVVRFINEGKSDFEEILEIKVKKMVKVIKVKSTMSETEPNFPERVMGVTIDITLQEEKLKLESKLKVMEADQNQKIFQAILNTQEEERKRIAESLHNSLGQLLYGVKLSLGQLNFDKLETDVNWLKEAKKTADHLLSESIKETRRISHEITPTILEEFGLKAAVDDVCKQFKQGLKIECHFTGLKKLNKYLEIALYRTIQELVTNVFKHAQATEALVSIVMHKNAVSLIVQDNGIGFTNVSKDTGIGLRTIRNKVKLLNGKFNLSWGENENTVISIRIPYEPE